MARDLHESVRGVTYIDSFAGESGGVSGLSLQERV